MKISTFFTYSFSLLLAGSMVLGGCAGSVEQKDAPIDSTQVDTSNSASAAQTGSPIVGAWKVVDAVLIFADPKTTLNAVEKTMLDKAKEQFKSQQDKFDFAFNTDSTYAAATPEGKGFKGKYAFDGQNVKLFNPEGKEVPVNISLASDTLVVEFPLNEQLKAKLKTVKKS